MNYTVPTEFQQESATSFVNRKLRNSMLWMVWGLFTTFLVALYMLFNPRVLVMAMQNYNIILIAELAIVFLFSARVMSTGLTALKTMFFAYSILNGLTLTVVAVAYGAQAVFSAFIGTLVFFVSFAIVGFVIKKDLSSFAPYLLAVLVAMIVLGLLNAFWLKNTGLSLWMSYLGVILFSIFTMYDVNRIKKQIVMYAHAEDASVLERVELAGALSLYLDFINIFLSLLNILRRN